MRIFRRFNNLPIEKKLLLVSVIPILTLAVLSIITFNSVQTFSRDEDRLNQVYHVQTTAADYLRLIVDLETGFRGFVLTLQPKFLESLSCRETTRIGSRTDPRPDGRTRSGTTC